MDVDDRLHNVTTLHTTNREAILDGLAFTGAGRMFEDLDSALVGYGVGCGAAFTQSRTTLSVSNRTCAESPV